MINKIKEAINFIDIGAWPVFIFLGKFILIITGISSAILSMAYLLGYCPVIFWNLFIVIGLLITCYLVGRDIVENE